MIGIWKFPSTSEDSPIANAEPSGSYIAPPRPFHPTIKLGLKTPPFLPRPAI
ncbi:hypothetical protein [Okeania sp. SIO2C9]|uniref:hypothetical protein n=1 Tax=Okeania sp. SIO2C9 TaxID=2607791 RepID=UPI0025E79C1C|nr:hypothetical protein [Okeania sp. SIO2C9]